MKDYNKLFQGLTKELQKHQHIKIDTSESDFSSLKKSHLSYFDFSIPDKHGFTIPKEKHEALNAFKKSRLYWFYEIDNELKGAGDFFFEKFLS